MTLKSIPAKVLRKIGVDRNSNLYVFSQKIYWNMTGQKEHYHTFSQFGEDQILRVFLPENSGKYLDIGSGHFRHGNNSYFLYKRGWSGIVAEPIKSFSKQYKFFRRRDELIAICFAKEPNEGRTFYEYHPWQLSTMSEERVRDLKIRGITPRRTFSVATRTVASLNLRVKPGDPFLLCMDVEGWELEVLAGIDWEGFRPRIICLEDFGDPINRGTPIKRLMSSLDYRLVGQAFLSSIYVHENYLKDNFFARSLKLYGDGDDESSCHLTGDEE